MLEKSEDFEMTMPKELRHEIMKHLAVMANRRAKKLRTAEVLFRLCEIAFVFSAIDSAFVATDNHTALSLIVLACVIGALGSHAQANNYQTLKEKTKLEHENMEKWIDLF